MQGLIHRALQCFLYDTYGAEFWRQLTIDLDLEFSEFEAMLFYSEEIIYQIVQKAAAALNKREKELLEDLGIYLISDKRMQSPRRLLRFGGVSFEEFVWSLDELRERVFLAIPDLHFPKLSVLSGQPKMFQVQCENRYKGFSHVLVGILRAMADDYGDLVLIEHGGQSNDKELIYITLLQPSFAPGRDFVLVPKGV